MTNLKLTALLGCLILISNLLTGCALQSTGGQPSKLVTQIDALTGAVEGIVAALGTVVPANIRTDVQTAASNLTTYLSCISTAALSTTQEGIAAAQGCWNKLPALSSFPAAVQQWVGSAWAIASIVAGLVATFSPMTALARAPAPPGSKPALPLNSADRNRLKELQPRILALQSAFK